MKNAYKDIEGKMKKSVHFLEEELAGIRAGRANPTLLDKIQIDYYGTPTPINQVGNISVPEARLMIIQPWDASMLNEIEKAILKSDLGISPNNDGKILRLVFPPLTEERRKDLKKVVHKKGEETKVAIRTVRRDALDHFKKDKKNSVITEDDLKDIEKDIQELTNDYIKEVDRTISAKEKELMEV